MGSWGARGVHSGDPGVPYPGGFHRWCGLDVVVFVTFAFFAKISFFFLLECWGQMPELARVDGTVWGCLCRAL